MFSLSAVFLFIASSILLILVPGPDIVFLITQGITKGKKAGLFTSIGLTLGNAVHTLAAALGLSVIFKTSEVAFVLFKTCGALYLFNLAYQAVEHRNDPLTAIDIDHHGSNYSGLLLRGFYMNIFNPKVALFFLAFLPQFVNPEFGSIPLQIIFLGLIFMGLVALIFGSLGYLAGSLGNWILKKRRFSKVMHMLSATIFGALGLKLLTITR